MSLTREQRKVKLEKEQAEMKAQVLARAETKTLDQPAKPRKPRSTRPAYELFIEKVGSVEKNGCWLWGGPLYRDKKYGRFCNHRGHSPSAHRASWEIFRGPIPEGLNVCHHCDTPLCVNPDHLFLGTDKDNMQDMVRKRRWGGNDPRLTDAQVRAIRKDKRPYKVVANEYGINANYVNDIKSRRKRFHVL